MPFMWKKLCLTFSSFLYKVKFKAKKIDKTFDFFITKQALEQKDVKALETEGAQISVENLDITIREKPENNNYFHINGILFLE